MPSRLRFLFSAVAVGVFLVSAAQLSLGQQSGQIPLLDRLDPLPDAPQAAADAAGAQQTPTPPQTAPATTAPASSPGATQQQSSSAQLPAGQPKSDRDLAEEQLKQQEHQRVAGVMATFNTTANREALPLSPSQKFRLFFRSATDPWPFLLSGITAGIGQADNNPPEWGQGLKGYAKRFGGNYSDYFIGNFFGNAVLPSLIHEDPRYFQKGTGSHAARLGWAAASSFWCRRDNGKWGPNYANVGGNLIGSAIARVYYPASERHVGDTITDGLTVTVEGIVGAEVIEFWPDLARYIKRKHQEKLARQAAAQQHP